jgi:hypothetical protein
MLKNRKNRVYDYWFSPENKSYRWGSEMNIKINDNKINRVDFVKSLGVHIDEHLSWSVGLHIRKLCKKNASAIGALKRIRPFITTNTAIQVYQSLIQPHFDYCCSV